MRRGDAFHLGLMLGALALAYALPFELLLLAYAVLGPAHYFTEISWLHDRKYFLPHRGFALPLIVVGGIAFYYADDYALGLVTWCLLLGAAILATAHTPRQALTASVVGVAVTLACVIAGLPFFAAGVLLPTFIHVCVFTLAFMSLGALRSGSRIQFALVGIYLASIALILIVPPTNHTVVPALARIGQTYFGGVAPALGTLFGIPDLSFGGRITGLLSFVYTYHYLNWFIKADVIRWTAVPRPRLIAVALLSAASTALYFYNYAIGIAVLLAVSFGHVLLEFPLNGLAFRDLGAALFGRSLRRSTA
ncbi:MAG: hypothetical protein JSR60_08450 [Proteobacteria bacterium]|nr:hypothetical protein [Pseudomonadota bacterium]